MRKSIYILFALTCNIAFSQIEKSDDLFLSTLNFENKEEVLDFLTKKDAKKFSSEIVNLNIKNIKNNSEGKFNLNHSNKKYFVADKTTTSVTIFNQNQKVQEVKLDQNISSSVKKEFINEIILKKLAKEIEEYMHLKDALTYGDRNIDLYRSYLELENKLIVSYAMYKNIELQIGKDIYPYLNKTTKTELDKTLQNSLNLLAVNF